MLVARLPMIDFIRKFHDEEACDLIKTSVDHPGRFALCGFLVYIAYVFVGLFVFKWRTKSVLS